MLQYLQNIIHKLTNILISMLILYEEKRDFIL